MRPPDFWTRRDPFSRFAVALLTPFGWLYGWSVQYRAGHTATYRSSAKVICVGNLTAGGTGKTPIAIAIGKALIARGAKPAYLTRGYGGTVRGLAFVAPDDRATHVGDDPLLLRTSPMPCSAKIAAKAVAELNVCGPASTPQCSRAGSRGLCPPRGMSVPPRKVNGTRR